MDKFWTWLWHGSREGPRGIFNVADRYIAVHCGISTFLVLFLKNSPIDFAQKALFPACSILVGLSMAWTTRAATLLQSKDLRDKLFTAKRPAEDYIYGFQLAILIVIVMICYLAIMAGGGLNVSVFGQPWDLRMSSFWMFFLISMTLRECWGVINATNMLSMLEYIRTK